MTTWRLDSIAPALALSFRSAPVAKRRTAGLLAAEYAVSSTGLLAAEYAVSSTGVCGEDVDAALGLLRDESFAPPPLQERLAAMVAGLDERYFALLDDDGYAPENSEAHAHFSKARAASALAFASSGDAAQLHEAIYEALAAVPDREHLVDEVRRALL